MEPNKQRMGRNPSKQKRGVELGGGGQTGWGLRRMEGTQKVALVIVKDGVNKEQDYIGNATSRKGKRDRQEVFIGEERLGGWWTRWGDQNRRRRGVVEHGAVNLVGG